jgi:CRP/FNR family transcriptional regulator, cyclic AMP receptor protein
MASTKEYLEKIPMFSGLSKEELELLSDYEVEKTYQKGEPIFMEGDPGKAVYYIKSGKIKLYKTSLEGREVTLNILGPGSIFAEVTMFSDLDYPATAMVLEEVLVGMIRNEDLEKIVQENGNIALSLIKELNRRLYYAQMKIKDMALHDVNGRVAKVLLDLAYRYGKKNSRGIQIDLKMTKTEIANIVGTSRETVSRSLSQLKSDEVIDMKGKLVFIKSLEDLEDLSL